MMNNGSWPLTLTCERTTALFWAEPVNALTSFFCLLACWICWRERKRLGERDVTSLIQVVWVGILSVTSFLIHTVPTPLISLIDTALTGGFILFSLFAVARRHLGKPIWASLASVLGFLVFAYFIADFANSVVSRSTALFIPVVLVFPLITAVMSLRAEGLPISQRDRHIESARLMMFGGFVFIAAVVMRALDKPFCGYTPFGLHFLWHIGFSAALGLITLAYIRNAPTKT